MSLSAVTPPEGTLRDWLDARAAEGGIGFTFPEGAPDLSWDALQQAARAIAADLTARGVAHGESVAILQPNGREAILALYGVLYGGFRATMINLAAGAEAVAYALDHSEARFAFVAAGARKLFQSADPTGHLTVLSVAEAAQRAPGQLHDLCASDHALLMYTSGTTGRPKGVVHSHSSLLAGGWTTAIAHNLGRADIGLCVLPIYHINGLCVTVMGALVSGGALAICSRFSASKFWQQAEQAKATWFSVVPTIISHLLHHQAEPDPTARARLRFGRSASAALPIDVHRAFETRFGMPLIETMGLTETAAQILSNPLPPSTRKIGSPGIGIGNEVAIFDKALKSVPEGVEGEIVVRGPNVMLQYLKNPEATAKTFTPDGWLRTGDLGRMDGEGYVFVTGRLKELIIKGGENIAPREVDEALYSHADVIEAAAFARPCAVYGERVEAAVKLKPGSALTTERLIAICVERLGQFKSPDAVHILEELPKGPSGKIQRLKLAELTG